MNNDDMELVQAYAVHQSEEAFETLVSRYVNLVYSAAIRQVHDEDMAEEITQVVFIILARKAGKLGPKTILPSWLHRTAGFAAANALRVQHRRAQREHEAHMQNLSGETASEETWMQIAPLLDSAMGQLGQKDHAALVLRFFENRNFKEVGTALGASEDAAKKRVNRALEKLKKFFTKRGVSSTTMIIAGVISSNSVQAAPVALAKSVTAAAITKGVASSVSTLTLMKGALKLMAWTKAKTAVVATIVVVLTAGTTMVAMKTVLAPINLKDAYVKLYSGPSYGGEVLTDLPWEGASNNIALRGDVENFDGLLPDSRDSFDFNDKAVSAVYLLPKGYKVILYEAAKFDGRQYRLLGTGKVEKIPDFNIRYPGFDDRVSSLQWIGANEMGPQPTAFKQLESTPGFLLTSDAVAFLHELRIEGKLPGIQKDEQIVVLLPLASTNTLNYPVVRNFSARQKDASGPWPYHFIVIKTAATNGWQLQKAWRTDMTGKVAEEYSIP